MCYLIPPAEIYDCTNLQASVSFFSTCLGNFHAFLASVDLIKTSLFFKKVLPKIKSNSLDDDQARWFVGPDLFKVSADGSDRQIAHKTSKFKNAAVVHNFAQILLYIYLISW